MSVLFFPFTYIDPQTMKSLSACFSKVSVYRTSDTELPDDMAKWVDSGFLDIRVPVKGEEKKIAAILKDYKAWADLHQKTPAAYFKQQSEVPFYSDTSISKIRTDITRRVRDNESNAKTEVNPEDRIFTARMFLTLAEEYDRNRFSIHTEFKNLFDMEKDLFEQLKGEPDERPPFPSHGFTEEKEDSGIYLTEERVKAWVRLTISDPKETGIYVTDSRGVFDFLDEHRVVEKEIFDMGPIPIRFEPDDTLASFKDQLRAFLDELARDPKALSSPNMPAMPQKRPGEPMLMLSALRIPGIHPKEYLGRFLPDSDNVLKRKENKQIKSTLICLLTSNSG